MENNKGKVLGTFSARKGQSGLPRPKVNELNIISGFGIEFDRFAGQEEHKAVMLVGKIAYDIAFENGMDLKHGSFGENMLFDFNPHDYKVGTIFKIGTTVLQITEKCTICNHLSVFGKKLPYLVKDCRGLYCKVLEGGHVLKDMEIEILLNWKSLKAAAC